MLYERAPAVRMWEFEPARPCYLKYGRAAEAAGEIKYSAARARV